MRQEPFHEDQELLSTALRSFLARSLPAASQLTRDIERAFAAPGKLFSQPRQAEQGIEAPPLGLWGLLSLSIAHYCHPQAPSDIFLPVALACETLMTALDCLDDVEDQDDTALRRELGDSRLLNLSTALLALAQSLLLEIPGKIAFPASLVSPLFRLVPQKLLHATQGQHQDLLAEQEEMTDITPEECLEIAQGKAGSLGHLVCHISALAAQTPQLARFFALLGERIAVAYQLDNDIRDWRDLLTSPTSIHKSDLLRNKKTLPIVLATQQFAYLQKTSPSADSEKRAVLSQRAKDDATRAALGVARYYRLRADLVAQQIEQRRGTFFSANLRSLCGLSDIVRNG